MPTDLRGVAERIIHRCQALAQLTDEPGQIQRTFLSPAMRVCMHTVRGWMEAAGMTTAIDAAGNLRGRYPGSSRVTLMMGSHLDTVPNSGPFDGVLGVIVGLALVEELQREPLPFAIELAAFSEEEGVRFKLPFIGSRAMVGRLDANALETTDANGISVASAITSFDLDPSPSKIGDCVLSSDVAAFLEFHIEQGVTLESEDRSLGVVEAIAGQSRAEITFSGEARHAGTTPMHLRHDAVAGAAEWVIEVERVGLATPGLVATVGDLRTHPGAGNVVAGQLKASLDVRHGDDAVRHQAVDHLLTQARRIAQRRGLTSEMKMQMNQPAVAMDARLCALAADAIRSAGIVPLTMVSGAGHDAMILAERVPATMIFLRSPGGISHHPDESVRPQDVENAVAAGLAFLDRFAASYTQKSGEQSKTHA